MLPTIDARPAPRRGTALMRTLSVLFVAAVAFATLYPLLEWRLRAPGPFAFLWAGLPRYWTWFDVASNVLAYGVLALLLTLGWLSRARPVVAVAAVTVAGSLLSLSLEAAQSYLPARAHAVRAHRVRTDEQRRVVPRNRGRDGADRRDRQRATAAHRGAGSLDRNEDHGI